MEDLTREISRLKKRLAKKERALRDARIISQSLESLFDGVNEEILLLDDQLKIIDANQTFLKRYKLSKKNAVEKTCYDIKDDECIRKQSKDGVCPVEQAQKTGKKVELSLSRIDENGDGRDLIVLSYPIPTGDGKATHFVVITRDVTEYQCLIEKVRSAEKICRAVLDSATDAIISIDDHHKIILFNQAAQRMFGYSNQEALGRSLDMIIPQRYGDHKKYVQRFLKNRSKDLIDVKRSLTGLRRHGEEFPIELKLSFMEMDGRMIITGMIRDLSLQQQIEGRFLQSTRLAAVGQAVAHVAHEIKNPLMIIGGFTSQIRANIKDEASIRKLDMVLEEVKRMENLVADLGDFTKEYQLIKRPADVNAVLRDVIKIMNGIYSHEKHYCFKELLSDHIGEIPCDPDKLKQVFMNIITNGIQAMKGGGTISVSTERIDNGVEIRINDEGGGIAESDLQYIFQPFFTTREKGSGLGLSISYKLIEAHDGDIWAVSHPGKGTTFFIQLPAG
ncbi:MAG: PAS domain S-box protein [Deltaproteobacteria bacterium]|nr:PAS domain S-box protein [Deltaproteobacteria bacterium]